MIRMVGGLIDCADKADALISRLETGLGALRLQTEKWDFRPKVYFEEWDDPLISGIRWISELVTIAGGGRLFCRICPRTSC
jgi:iron complex transport system substrate-binding protein